MPPSPRHNDMKSALLLSIAVAMLPSMALPCLNDRDSLYLNTMGRNGRSNLKTVVGWFPIHTDLYYEMRIERSSKELEKHPENLMLYDDIAVAYDHLGNQVRAIEVIEQKRRYMEEQGIKPPPKGRAMVDSPSKEEIKASSEEPWYRYHANVGTFWSHHWVKEGRPEKHKKEWLDRAQHHIDAGIAINPYAHGLREYAQSVTLRWLRTREGNETLYEFGREKWELRESVDALAGIIEQGGAWENVDIYHTISEILGNTYRRDFGYLVFQRVAELQAKGKKSVTGTQFAFEGSPPSDKTSVEKNYAKFRAAAENYRQSYQEFELTKLRQGLHPDTTPDFYVDFKEPSFPSFGRLPFLQAVARGAYLAELVLGFFVFAVSAWIIQRMMRRRRALRQSSDLMA